MGISCNRLRFRRGLPAIQHGTARLPRRQRLLAMTRQGGEAVYQWPPAVEWPCTGRSLTAPTAAGAVGGNAPQKFAAAHGAHCAPPHHSAAFSSSGRGVPLPDNSASAGRFDGDLTGDDLFHFGVFSVACGRAFAAVRLSSLALHGDLCHACPGSLHRDIPHLVAPDASSADCLYQQCQAVPAEARIAASMAFTDSSRYSRPDSPSSRRTTVPW